MKSNRMETAKICQMTTFIASSEISDATFSTYKNETFVENVCDENSVASSSDKSEEAVHFIDTMDFISHKDDDLDDFGNIALSTILVWVLFDIAPLYPKARYGTKPNRIGKRFTG
eukprot:7168858-Ditylum_brightwellii.AAC.1